MKKIILTAFVALAAIATGAQTKKVSLKTLQFRDPCILADKPSHTYYLYRSNSVKKPDGTMVGGVEVYTSTDLHAWRDPKQVLTLPSTNWSTGTIWAPEVHEYRGKYYAFVTVNSDIVWKKKVEGWPDYTWRGTQILRADKPDGPFLPLSTHQQTPLDEMALDGTLWVEDGVPYMVYCHEWVQLGDGAVNVIRLSPDLSKAVGAPQMLFRGSAAPWANSTGMEEKGLSISIITDGCYLYRTRTGKLLMIWSSYHKGEYTMGIAESVTGKIAGPWKQQPEPVYRNDGGHGMLFRTFSGQLCLTLHQPNKSEERVHIFKVDDLGNTLQLGAEIEQE